MWQWQRRFFLALCLLCPLCILCPKIKMNKSESERERRKMRKWTSERATKEIKTSMWWHIFFDSLFSAEFRIFNFIYWMNICYNASLKQLNIGYGWTNIWNGMSMSDIFVAQLDNSPKHQNTLNWAIFPLHTGHIV